MRVETGVWAWRSRLRDEAVTADSTAGRGCGRRTGSRFCCCSASRMELDGEGGCDCRGRAGLLLGAERSASTLGSAATDARGRSLTRCCRSPASRLGSRTHGGRGAVVVELDEKGALAAASLLDVATVASTRSDGVVAAAGARARPKLGAARRLWLRGEVVLGVAGWWSRAAASWGRRGERRLGLLYASWPRVLGC